MVHDGIVELVIWEVPITRANAEGIKYRCAYIPFGEAEPAVLYDNHYGKSHHRHLEGTENVYDYEDISKLLTDFFADVTRARFRRRK